MITVKSLSNFHNRGKVLMVLYQSKLNLYNGGKYLSFSGTTNRHQISDNRGNRGINFNFPVIVNTAVLKDLMKTSYRWIFIFDLVKINSECEVAQ